MISARQHISIILVIILLALFPLDALAQVTNPINDSGAINDVVNEFFSKSKQFQARIVPIALTLFSVLVSIDIAWLGFRMVTENADLQTWSAELIKRILIIGFYLLLLQTPSVASDIIAGFEKSAQIGAGTSAELSPSGILNFGIKTSDRVMDELSWRKGSANFGLVFVAVICVICFALAAALLAMALVEIYILTNVGILLLAFGGFNQTSDFARKYITYLVSAGVKLFVMYIVVAIGLGLMQDFVNNFENDNHEGVMLMVGISIMFLALVRTLPDLVQSMIQGVALGNSGGLVAAAASTAGGAMGAARGAVAAGQKANQLKKAAEIKGVNAVSAVKAAVNIKK